MRDFREISNRIASAFERISYLLLFALSVVVAYLILLIAIGQSPEEGRAILVVGIPLALVYVTWKASKQYTLFIIALWVGYLLLHKVLHLLGRIF